MSSRVLQSLLIPPGFAHGYLTLEADSLVTYLISPAYVPQAARGLRWDDPGLGIEWPHAPSVISDRDSNHPLVSEGALG